MPRAMYALFSALNGDEMSRFKETAVKLSYLEIYNESIKV
jgi:hypothetical protein